MRKAKVTINHKGLMAAKLRLLADDVEAAGRSIAGNVSGYSTGVQTETNRDGDPVALVALTEPNGVAIEAKTGVLSRAARSAGLKVHRN